MFRANLSNQNFRKSWFSILIIKCQKQRTMLGSPWSVVLWVKAPYCYVTFLRLWAGQSFRWWHFVVEQQLGQSRSKSFESPVCVTCLAWQHDPGVALGLQTARTRGQVCWLPQVNSTDWAPKTNILGPAHRVSHDLHVQNQLAYKMPVVKKRRVQCSFLILPLLDD